MTNKELRNKYKCKKQNAKQRGLEFSLSFESFCLLLNETHCFYTGEKMSCEAIHIKQQPNSLTIDRVNNFIGYVDGNCVACTHAVNSFKSMIEINRSLLSHPYYQPIIDGIKRFDDNKKTIEIKQSKFKRIVSILFEK